MTTETAYRCTLPECLCGGFTPGKTQMRTCDNCKHGWVAHDLISETQAKKIRKRGVKDGTPCQNPSCVCGNYQPPPGVPRTSWLAVCDNCKHTETEHRYPTKLDRVKKHNREKASDYSCVGCEMKCSGFQYPDDSLSGENPATRKCRNCNHIIDTHRPATSLDTYISQELDSCSSLRCHCHLGTGNKQVRPMYRGSSDADDDAVLNAWLEPTNIDHDDDVPFLDANTCQCKGFSFDDMARICNQYFGLTEDIVGPRLPVLACQLCSHALQHHRQHTKKELAQLDIRKLNNLTMVGVVSVPAHSQPGFQHNVSLGLLDIDKLASHKMFLAVINSNKSDDSSQKCSIAIGRTTFVCHRGHNRRRHASLAFNEDEGESLHSLSDEEAENGRHGTSGKKRRKKMARIMDDVKRRIKRRKIGSKSVTTTSDSESEPTTEDMDHNSHACRSLHLLGEQSTVAMEMTGHITTVAWSHDATTQHQVHVSASSQLAIATDEKRLMIYKMVDDMSATVNEAKFPEGVGPCTVITWYHSSKCLLSGHSCGATLLWKLANTHHNEMEWSNVIQYKAKSRVTSICVSRDDRYSAVGHQNGMVLIFDSAKGSFKPSGQDSVTKPHLVSSCSIAYGAVLCLAWHPTRLLVAAGGEDDLVTVFYMKKPTSQAPRGTLKHFFGTKSPRKPSQKGFHRCCTLKGHKSFVGAVTFDLTGNFLLSSGWDGQLLFWNVTDIDDVIESEDEANSEIICSSGFVMGRSSRGQSLEGRPQPFVPLAIATFGSFVVLLLRTSVARISLVMYEIPRRYLELSNLKEVHV